MNEITEWIIFIGSLILLPILSLLCIGSIEDEIRRKK